MSELREMIDMLLSLDGGAWDRYAFSSEIYHDRLSPTQKEAFARGSQDAGILLAKQIKSGYPGKTAADILGGKNVVILELDPGEATMGARTVFAYYEAPLKVYVNRDAVSRCASLLDQEDCGGFLGGVKLEDILLAHELYHLLAGEASGHFPSQKMFEVWRVACFSNKVALRSLREIAATAFTQDFLNLPFSPFVLDVPLLYAVSRENARRLFEKISRPV